MTTGTVKWFNSKKGYGFITPTPGSTETPAPEGTSSDIFVHHSAIQVEGEEEFRSLNEGDEVEFEIAQGAKGPEAKNVKVTKKAPPPPPRERSDRGYGGGRPNFGHDYRPQRGSGGGRDDDRRGNRRGFSRGGGSRRGGGGGRRY